MATVVAVTTFFTLAIVVTVIAIEGGSVASSRGNFVASMNKWKNPHTFGGDFVAPAERSSAMLPSSSSVIIPYGKRIVVLAVYDSDCSQSTKVANDGTTTSSFLTYVTRVGCMNSIDTARSEYVLPLIIFVTFSPSMFAIANS